MKQCSCCGVLKPADKFYKHTRTGRLMHRCSYCTNRSRAEYQRLRKASIRAGTGSKLRPILKTRSEATFEVLDGLLRYDPNTGLVYWKEWRGGHGKPGEEAGTLGANGYVYISISSRRYLLHRVAWLLSYREWPKQTINHINGIKTDNRLSNLEDVSLAENIRHAQRLGLINNRRLTVDQVRQIRNADLTPSELARVYGVSMSTIYRILNFQGWKEVEQQ
jgi:hypothetical protein